MPLEGSLPSMMLLFRGLGISVECVPNFRGSFGSALISAPLPSLATNRTVYVGDSLDDPAQFNPSGILLKGFGEQAPRILR